jgi:hypothetical protein
MIISRRGWTIGWRGFDSRQGLGILLFDIMSRPALGSTQSPIQCVPGAHTLRVKRSWRTDHSPPSSDEVKECVELYLHSRYVFTAWCLVTTLHLPLPLPHGRMTVSDVLERRWREAVVAHFDILFNFLEGVEENYEHLNQNIWSPGRDSNKRHLRCKAKKLTTTPRISVSGSFSAYRSRQNLTWGLSL